MTYSVVPALRHEPELAAEWEPRLTVAHVRPGRTRPPRRRPAPPAAWRMTEKQGGSDVRANTTVAVADRPTASTALTGHKWFCSAPMSDAFLMLAQAPGGLSCFLVPRWLPDGARNPIRIQRLKDKLGDRSNASSEIELRRHVGCAGRRRGSRRPHDHRDGQPHPPRLRARLDRDHAAGRRAGDVAHPPPRGVRRAARRAAVDGERARRPRPRVRSRDRGRAAPRPRVRRRRRTTSTSSASSGCVTPVIKYWTCKRAPQHAAEALECLGGAGYVEESDLPRLFRQSPLNGVWEGSGNVICLDVLRAIAREPASLDAYWDEVGLAGRRRPPTRRRRRRRCAKELRRPRRRSRRRARRLVERLALVFQASLLVRHAPPAVADAFCASRLAGDAGRAFGTLPPRRRLRGDRRPRPSGTGLEADRVD